MDFRIIHIDETDSTNRWLRANGQDYTSSVASDGADGHTVCEVVVAEYQTAGRGCGTNTWESERSKNLTFSLMLHPEWLPARRQFLISQAVSVALCETLETYIYNKVEIKWPNDIYVGDRKICGILIENRLKGPHIADSIVGIGLNVNQAVFVSDAPNPVSLYQLTGKETDRDELLQRFLKHLEDAVYRPAALMGYEERLYRREGWHAYKDAEGCFEAKMDGVMDDGRLMLTDSGGNRRVYAFKEVTFVI